MMALNWDNIIITTDEYSYSIDAEQRMIIFSGAPGSAGPAGPADPGAPEKMIIRCSASME